MMMRLRPTWLRTWAGILAIELCLLMGKSSAYPDISGSCNGVFSDAHLPRKVSGDGGFKVMPSRDGELAQLVSMHQLAFLAHHRLAWSNRIDKMKLLLVCSFALAQSAQMRRTSLSTSSSR